MLAGRRRRRRGSTHRRHPSPILPAPNTQRSPQACYVWYNEMYKCYSQKGQDADECKKIKKDVR